MSKIGRREMPYRAIWPKRRATANMTTNANPSAAKKKLKRKRSATPKTVSVPENTVSIPNFIPKDSSPLQQTVHGRLRAKISKISTRYNRSKTDFFAPIARIIPKYLRRICTEYCTELYRLSSVAKKIVPPNTYRNNVTYLPTS